MAALSRLYVQVRLACKGVPDVTIDDAVRISAREFCRKTWYCTRTIEVTEVAGAAFYDVAPESSNEEIIGIKAVEGERILYPTRQEDVKYEEGNPRNYIYLPPSTLELVPYPAADELDLETYRVRIVITPTVDCTELPDDLFPDFEQTIAYGAIRYIAEMPGELWTNEAVVTRAEKKFAEGLRHAKTKAVFGHQGWDGLVNSGGFAI